MRKTVTSIISATALLGASSLALAASPSVSDQSQLNSGATATPNSRTGSQAAPYSNSGTSKSGDTTLKSGGASGMTSGSGTSAQVTDQAQVKQQLEQQGYTNVQNVRKDRTGWTAKAKKDGQLVTVNVDNSGQVKTR
jgi:hypothetical protein